MEVVDSKEIEKRKSKIKNFFLGWIKDNYDKTFLVVLILALILRIWIFTKTLDQALWFDTAEYLSTGKYWAGMSSHMSDIWYYRRGFLWPLFSAFFFKIGLGESTIRFTEVIFSTGIVFLTYRLISIVYNKKLALASSIAMTFSWVLFFFSGRPMTDIPASFFILLSLLFFWKGYVKVTNKKHMMLFGIFLAIAVLIRMQTLIFIPCFIVYAFTKEKFKFLKNKKLWLAILMFAIMLIPHFVIYNHNFGNPVKDMASHYLGFNVEGTVSHNEQGGFSKMLMYFPDIPYLLFGSPQGPFTSFLKLAFTLIFLLGAFMFFGNLFLGFDKIFSNKKLQRDLFVLSWFIIPYLLLGRMAGLVEQRYFIAIMPFLFAIFLTPFLNLGKLNIFKNKKKFFVIILLIALLFIPNLQWGNQLTEMKKTSYHELKLAGEWLKENSDLQDVIVTNSFPQISYYSERRVATFSGGLRNPEDHLGVISQEEFNEFMQQEKPRFIVLSIFENHKDWMYSYPKDNPNWIPVIAFPPTTQPLLIIYEYQINNA